MTTMNYPANYTAIAADEMVYLNGGADLSNSLSAVQNFCYGVAYGISTILTGMSASKYLTGESDVGTGWSAFSAVRTFVNTVYYAFTSVNYFHTIESYL